MNKKINIAVLCVLICWCAVGPARLLFAQNTSKAMKEIRELYDKKSYSIVLEKALGVLNTREDRLLPSESAFLHYYIGLAYKQNGNREMAIDYLRKLELKFPKSEFVKPTLMELADLFKDDYFQQEAYLEKVFENYPRTPEAIDAGIRLSRAYIRLKNYRKALPVLETMVNLWKAGDEFPELNMLMTVAYSGTKDYIEAIVYLRIAEKKILPKILVTPRYLFEAGKVFYHSTNFDKAITYLEKLLNVFPNYINNGEATILLAQSYEKVGKLFMSAVFLIKAIEKKPPKKTEYALLLNLGRSLGRLKPQEIKIIKQNYPLHSDAKKLLTLVKSNSPRFEDRREAALLLSGELKKTDNLEGAIEQMRTFLNKERDPVIEKNLKKDLNEYLDQLGSVEQSQELFRSWVKLKRRKSFLSGENLVRFGKKLYQQKLYHNAEEVYLHLIKYKMFSELWPEARRQLARIYFRIGNHQKCLENIDRLNFPKEPEKSEFNYYKCSALKQLDKKDRVKTLLENVSYKKLDTLYQYRLAQLKAIQLEEDKNYNEALEYYQKMLQFNGSSKKDQGQLMSSIGDLYFKVKDLEASLSYYRLAEQYNVNLEWALYRITTILWELDKKDEAKKALEKLKNVTPNSFWVNQLEKYVR